MKYQTSCKIYFRDNNLFGLRIVLVYHVTWLNWNRTVYFTPLMWRRNLTKYFTSFNLSITRLSSSVVSLSIFKFSLFSSPLHLFHSHSPYLPRCIFSFLSLYSDLFFLYSINFSLLFFASSFSPLNFLSQCCPPIANSFLSIQFFYLIFHVLCLPIDPTFFISFRFLFAFHIPICSALLYRHYNFLICILPIKFFSIFFFSHDSCSMFSWSVIFPAFLYSLPRCHFVRLIFLLFFFISP